ncbi:hypothetical protein, partial [Aeromonas caviae]|uniref:hypothetical protein n=1 Tax=Aeromonas caviae TaxID=648 RepID=UPI002B46539C
MKTTRTCHSSIDVLLYAGIRLFMFFLSLISIKSNGKNVFIYIALRAYHPHVMTREFNFEVQFPIKNQAAF